VRRCEDRTTTYAALPVASLQQLSQGFRYRLRSAGLDSRGGKEVRDLALTHVGFANLWALRLPDESSTKNPGK
jgi:hypothetical protein